MPDTETEPRTVDFDLRTLTLGELAAVEAASGASWDWIMAHAAHRRIMVLYVTDYRAHRQSPRDVPMPQWSDYADLRVRGG